MAANNNPTGEGETPAEKALRLLTNGAPEAARKVLDIAKKPPRNAMAQLAACKLVLELAGVGAAEADKRHTELLQALRYKVSESAFDEIVSALAAATGQRGGAEERESDPTVN